MTRSPRTPSEVRALMRGAPEMLASAKIPDRVQCLAEREGPRDWTISATLLKMVRIDPGISTRDLVLWTGKAPTSGNVAFVGTLLNAMRRRGLVANRSEKRGSSAWMPSG